MQVTKRYLTTSHFSGNLRAVLKFKTKPCQYNEVQSEKKEFKKKEFKAKLCEYSKKKEFKKRSSKRSFVSTAKRRSSKRKAGVQSEAL
jgi:hypothetical protein